MDKDTFGVTEGVARKLAEHSSLDIYDIKSKDGLLTRDNQRHNQSFLHRVISVGKIQEELKTALWKSIEEPDLAVAAWYQAWKLGLDTTPVELTIIARNAGINHELLKETLHTISNTTFTTNYQKDEKPRGRIRKESVIGQ